MSDSQHRCWHTDGGKVRFCKVAWHAVLQQATALQHLCIKSGRCARGTASVGPARRRHGVAAAAAARGFERALQRRLSGQILGCSAHQLLWCGVSTRQERMGADAQRAGEAAASAGAWCTMCRSCARCAACHRKLHAPVARLLGVAGASGLAAHSKGSSGTQVRRQAATGQPTHGGTRSVRNPPSLPSDAQWSSPPPAAPAPGVQGKQLPSE